MGWDQMRMRLDCNKLEIRLYQITLHLRLHQMRWDTSRENEIILGLYQI